MSFQTRMSYYSKHPGAQGLQKTQVTVFHCHLGNVHLCTCCSEQGCLYPPELATSPTQIPIPTMDPGPVPACPASLPSSAPSLTQHCPQQSIWEDLTYHREAGRLHLGRYCVPEGVQDTGWPLRHSFLLSPAQPGYSGLSISIL